MDMWYLCMYLAWSLTPLLPRTCCRQLPHWDGVLLRIPQLHLQRELALSLSAFLTSFLTSIMPSAADGFVAPARGLRVISQRIVIFFISVSNR